MRTPLGIGMAMALAMSCDGVGGPFPEVPDLGIGSSPGSAGDGGTAAGGGTGTGTGGGVATGGGTGTPTVPGTPTPPGTLPRGWLFTQGNKVHVSDGAGAGPVWMGRGVNIDDAFMCGYNWNLSVADPETAMKDILANVMRDWRPNFLRIQMGLNSYTPVSWVSNTAQYRDPMVNLVKAIGTYPDTYVLVTLRSDASMMRLCTMMADATCLPNTPGSSDDFYRSIVDAFAAMPHVLLSVANEPGGMSATDDDLRATMSHALTVIRAEEDRLGVPHHLVSVQGNMWTSRIGFYDAAPLPFDNVVYEYHSYPPEATGLYGYTWANLPVIIGEYGPHNGPVTDTETLPGADALYADLEAKQIPNLAWDISPYSNCAPDMVSRTMSATLTPVAWGQTVKAYLNAHRP